MIVNLKLQSIFQKVPVVKLCCLASDRVVFPSGSLEFIHVGVPDFCSHYVLETMHIVGC